MRLIDPHVHLRDWNQAHKETLAHAFHVARTLGISALFEMPNTDPPLTGRETVLKRIADADHALGRGRGHGRGRGPGRITEAPFHGLYVGLTEDPAQVRHAAALRDELFPRVVGCKMYAGHSTGRMGVITPAGQLRVWRALAAARYRGVVAVHAEREDLLRPDLAVPGDPRAHGASRPPLAEIASVQTQIALAEAARFRGTLHICHVSTPEALEIITKERSALPFRLTAGVTPHHLLLDTEYADSADDADGPGFTVNPPLRDRSMRLRLWETVLAGNADWIESDHAPHTWDDKLAGAAGLPGLPALCHLAGELARHVDGATVRAMTGERVLEVFGIDPELLPDEDARANATLPDAATEYPWDPYRGITW